MSQPKKFKKLKWNPIEEEDSLRSRKQTLQITQPKPFCQPRFEPLTQGQEDLAAAIDENRIIFGIGPAGAGKSHIAVALAVEALKSEDIEHIILARPCVVVGGKAKTGFLPGTLEEKVSVYLRPLLDELRTYFPPKDLRSLIDEETIELTSIEYVRGRSIKNTYLIVDEAQNLTYDDIKVILTRLDQGSKILLMGDITRDEFGRLCQCDLPREEQGAFEKYADRFADIPGIATVTLTVADIVRDPIVKAMIERGF